MGPKEKEARAARSKSAVTFETGLRPYGSPYILSSAGDTNLAESKMACQGYIADGTVDITGDSDFASFTESTYNITLQMVLCI
jgi:hypothetical protein